MAQALRVRVPLPVPNFTSACVQSEVSYAPACGPELVSVCYGIERGLAQLVARKAGGLEATGSSPVSPTKAIAGMNAVCACE